MAPPKRRARAHKYGAQPTIVDGIWFASKKEARRYGQLKLLQKAGKISDLQLQVAFPITIEAKYVADFVYVDNLDGAKIVEDAKGFRTAEYRRKKKCMAKQHGVEIREV